MGIKKMKKSKSTSKAKALRALHAKKKTLIRHAKKMFHHLRRLSNRKLGKQPKVIKKVEKKGLKKIKHSLKKKKFLKKKKSHKKRAKKPKKAKKVVKKHAKKAKEDKKAPAPKYSY